VNALFLRHLADQYDGDSDALAWYVKNGEQSHPFPGIYTPDATDALADALQEGNWGMVAWLKNNRAEILDVTEQAPAPDPDQQLMNINRPSDLKNVFREL
jgi:molybdopterin-guanine dinucleotide biosynthesis protein A